MKKLTQKQVEVVAQAISDSPLNEEISARTLEYFEQQRQLEKTGSEIIRLIERLPEFPISRKVEWDLDHFLDAALSL